MRSLIYQAPIAPSPESGKAMANGPVLAVGRKVVEALMWEEVDRSASGGKKGTLPFLGQNLYNTCYYATNARTVIANIPLHITQRGNRRETVFFIDEDRKEYFLFCLCGLKFLFFLGLRMAVHVEDDKLYYKGKHYVMRLESISLCWRISFRINLNREISHHENFCHHHLNCCTNDRMHLLSNSACGLLYHCHY